jgi:hypothetical protein
LSLASLGGIPGGGISGADAFGGVLPTTFGLGPPASGFGTPAAAPANEAEAADEAEAPAAAGGALNFVGGLTGSPLPPPATGFTGLGSPAVQKADAEAEAEAAPAPATPTTTSIQFGGAQGVGIPPSAFSYNAGLGGTTSMQTGPGGNTKSTINSPGMSVSSASNNGGKNKAGGFSMVLGNPTPGTGTSVSSSEAEGGGSDGEGEGTSKSKSFGNTISGPAGTVPATNGFASPWN